MRSYRLTQEQLDQLHSEKQEFWAANEKMNTISFFQHMRKITDRIKYAECGSCGKAAEFVAIRTITAGAKHEERRCAECLSSEREKGIFQPLEFRK